MKLPIDKIKPNPKNPRFIKDDKFKKLVQSLRDFPEMLDAREIVVNKDYIILGGNMRYKAAREAGLKELSVKIVDWSESKQREFIAKDNAAFGEWDWDVLANEYDAEELDSWGIDLPKDFEPEVDIEEDEVPEPETGGVPVSIAGSVYQLGRHRLMCASSTELENVKLLMDGAMADMVFTDPPYNVDYTGKTKEALKIENDKKGEDFYQFLYDAISTLAAFTKGSIYLAMSSSELDTLQRAFRDAGGHWSTFIIWVKNTFTLGRSDYQRQYEPILYGWFEKSTHYWSGIRNLGDIIKQEEAYSDIDNNIYLKADNLSTDIWEFPKPTKSREHPTMKPVALVARAIRHSSKPRQIVLDTFAGSGTTLIAAQQLNRTAYLMELDPRYCDVIRKRYWKFVNGGNEEGWEDGTPAIA